MTSGFGLGFAPVAPGTFGSLLGIAVHLAWLQVTTALLPTCVAITVAIALASWLAGRVERELGSHDAGEIVIDEVIGMWIALLGVPASLPNLAMTFALFRLLDIVKPWPAGWIDRRLKGGAGVVLDDVMSGIYANLLMRLLL